MNVCVINYSSRENGNSNSASRYIQKLLADKGNNVRKIDFSLLSINACGHCNYECFDELCVYRYDDIYEAYRNLLDVDLAVSVIPIYGGLPCSNFFVFSERAQGAFYGDEFDKLEKVLNKYIIIGNTGIDVTKRIISENDKQATDGDFLVISSNEMGEKSIKGNLMDYSYYREKIDRFLLDKQ